MEIMLRSLLPNTGAHVNALPIATIAATLEKAGFTTATVPCWRGTPFANVLLAARRDGETSVSRPAAAAP
jgi:hypothetical protein